jgi:membrane protease YdiL (CAAX protease family)
MMTAHRAFLVASVLAGALAVPLHPAGTLVSALMAGLAAAIGLWLWQWSRLPNATHAPVPEGTSRVTRFAGAFALGLAVGLIALAVIRLVIEPSIPAAGARLAASAALPIWRRLIIIYVAAISEEIFFRLILLSVAAGALAWALRRPDRVPARAELWIANAVAAFAFGLVHLPSWTAIGPMSAGLMLMVVALNGAGGLVFGWMFIRRGIVAAIWAHAGADCAIQLIGPLTS